MLSIGNVLSCIYVAKNKGTIQQRSFLKARFIKMKHKCVKEDIKIHMRPAKGLDIMRESNIKETSLSVTKRKAISLKLEHIKTV